MVIEMPANNFIFVLIAVIIVLISCIIIKKMEWFLNFFIRLMVGGIALFLTSEILTELALGANLGVNPMNILVVAFLGVPGFVMLLCVEFYYIS